MPLAAFHAIITIVILAAIRKFLRINFSNRLLLFGGILGLLPDLDIPIALAVNWVLGTGLYLHKVYANALIIPLLIFITAIILKYYNYGKQSVIVLVVAVSYFFHIVLDCFFSLGLTANLLPGGEMLGMCRNIADKETLIIIDALFLGMFLIYLAYKAKDE